MAYLYHIWLPEFYFRIRAMARRKGGLCDKEDGRDRAGGDDETGVGWPRRR
jgi:hypothetical protein